MKYRKYEEEEGKEGCEVSECREGAGQGHEDLGKALGCLEDAEGPKDAQDPKEPKHLRHHDVLSKL